MKIQITTTKTGAQFFAKMIGTFDDDDFVDKEALEALRTMKKLRKNILKNLNKKSK